MISMENLKVSRVLIVHILILEQEFERRAITVISFGVLASEFHAESKNTNLFAGERHEFFGQKTKGGTLTVENFQ